ncbi:hypothetical protein D3C73_1458030 [compost metagenome]
MDLTVLVLDAVHREPAYRRQAERAVRTNRTDHCSECIDMGAQSDGPGWVKPVYAQDQAAFFIPGQGDA